MAVVKQEAYSEDIGSDIWLEHWANGDNDIKEEDKKPEMSDIKMEVQDTKNEDSELNGPKLFDDNKVARSKSTAGQKRRRKEKMSNLTKTVSDKENTQSSPTVRVPSWKEKIENAPVSMTIGSLCKYECLKCKFVCTSRYSLRKHLSKLNHRSGEKEINDYLTKIIAHICQVCLQKILCDNDAIYIHLRYNHGIKSVKEYSEKYDIEHKRTSLTFKIELDMFDQSKTRKNIVSKNIANLCTFSCPKCDYSCNSWVKMKNHTFVNEHGPLSTLKKYVKNVTFFQCQICEKMTLCDNYIVKNHLRHHNFGISKYKEKLKLPSIIEEIHIQYNLKLKAFLLDNPAVKARKQSTLAPNSIPDDQLTKDVGNISSFKCIHCSKTDIHLVLYCGIAQRSIT